MRRVIVILMVPLLFTICFARQEKPVKQSTDQAVQLDGGKGRKSGSPSAGSPGVLTSP